MKKKKNKNNFFQWNWKKPIIIGGVFLGLITLIMVLAVVFSGKQQGKVFTELQTASTGSQDPKQQCHFQGGNGKIVVDFDNHMLITSVPSANQFTKSVSIPAGEYKVYLESYDGYTTRRNSDPNRQKNEQYYVQFQHGNSTVATSNATPDLQDRVRSANFAGVVNSNLNISNTADRLVVKHKVPYTRNNPPANSVRAVCMMLEPVTSVSDEGCHLHGGSDSIVVNLDKSLCSHKHTPCNDHWTQNVNIPAGKYKVSLEAWDGYAGRSQTDPNGQKNEQYYVQFQRGNSVVATSGTTSDLQDRVESARFTGVVNESLNIPNSINKLTIRSKVPYQGPPNSVKAVCMMLEPIVEKTCATSASQSDPAKYLFTAFVKAPTDGTKITRGERVAFTAETNRPATRYSWVDTRPGTDSWKGKRCSADDGVVLYRSGQQKSIMVDTSKLLDHHGEHRICLTAYNDTDKWTSYACQAIVKVEVEEPVVKQCATSPTQTDLTKYKTSLFIVQPSNEITTITEGEHITLEGASNSNSISKWLWIDAKPGTESYKGNRCVIEDKRGYSSNPRNPFSRRGTFPSLKKIEGVTLSAGEHHICLAGVITSSMSGFDYQVPQECTPHIVVKVEPKQVSCGDGEVNQSTEECDEGTENNGKVCTAGYNQTCTYCDANCKEQTVVGPDCGDGEVNGDEQCDDGDDNGKVPTVGYGETAHYCKTDCTTGTVIGGQCGNGTVEGDEQCDLGTANNGKVCIAGYNQTCTYCDDTCQERTVVGPDCGDGEVNGDEQCDDGNNNGKVPTVGYGETAHYCKTDCTTGTVIGGQCGNGTVEGDEQCDDGNTINGDGCSSTCQTEQEDIPEEPTKPECKSSIGNYIWYDTNGNGVQEDIEEGIEGIKVCAFHGNKKYCDTTDKHGKYTIKDLCEGTYTVVVKDVDDLIQTYDPDGKKDNKTKVELKSNNDKHTKADFGYRGKAPSTGLATNIILLIGLSTLVTIGILLLMKKKRML